MANKWRYNPDTEQLEEYDDGNWSNDTTGSGDFNWPTVEQNLLNAKSDDDILKAIGINPDTTGKWDSPSNKQILQDIGYTGSFTGSDIGSFIKNAFTKKDGSLNIPALGALAGAGAGALGFGTATTKPTGYQGGIPQLTASQPMLTAPPTGRRPGSGGINYGTGVQYKDAKGNIVSDTSTSVADLLATAQANPYNQSSTYGKGTTGGGLTNLPSGGNTGGTDNTALMAKLKAALATREGSTGGPAAGSGIVNPPVNNGIATGIDPNRPWAKASSDPTIKAAQDALDQLSKTQGTPEQRQAALTSFLHTTKYTPTQLAAASNGQWGVQDLIDQMQGNTNVFNAQTPWSVYSTKADVKGVQDALQQLSQTPGTAAEKQVALTNFLKTTKYTPAQLAAASNGMWSVADLTTQMAGNPVLKQASNTPAGGSNTPAASTPTGGGFVTGGGGPPSAAEYAKMVAVKKAQDAADQAKLDAFHIAPNSPFYKYTQDPSLIPHLYNESDADALLRVKKNAMEQAENESRRANDTSSVIPGAQVTVASGGLFDTNHNLIPQGPNDTNAVVTLADGTSRYVTKTEAAQQEKLQKQWMYDQGYQVDPNKPWNVASTDTGTHTAQDALAKLNATTGTPAERQAALQNFLKTTTFTPEQLSAASNGQWAVSDLKSQMAGNSNLLDQGSPIVEDKASAGLANVAPVTTPAPVKFGGIQDEPTTTPSPVKFGGIQDEPAAPLSGLAALQAAAQTTYGRALTDAEQQALSGKSLEDAQGIMTQSMADWNASHPQAMAKGGLTNLDHGGFVIPADVVSHFGNGSSSAGLELLAQNMGAEPIKGQGDGMSDSIPAAIDGREKALVANDEAYLSPQMVERLGDGDMDAGSRKLKQMMEQIRKARTGSKEQGKQINPNNFMPGGTVGYAQGGGIKSFVTGGTTDPTASLVQSGVTGTEQNLSNWSGPAVTQMLGQAQALANTPYQAYTGPLTAGASDLQNQAFNTAANLPGGNQVAAYGNMAVNNTYTPQTTSFGTAQAQQYMNPYLQASLDPQLAEARRQSQITAQNNAASMTKAGAFGGGRQAIMSSENDRNLGTNLANITGQGYNTAYTNAMGQFNADQNRLAQESQFGATNKLAGLNTGIGAEQAASGIGINNLNQQANLGATQRGIESEGIAADKLQFEEARNYPAKMLQLQQSMLNGMPITAQNYNMSTPSTFTSAAGGATTLAQLLKNLGYTTTP